MNPAESREVFIRQALVDGEFNTTGAVLRAQPETDRRHRGAGAQGAPPRRAGGRRADLRVLRQPHSGEGIHNGAAFEHWRKEAEREQPKLLYLKKDDLMRHEAAGITTDQFPPQLMMNNVELSRWPTTFRPARATTASR